VAVNIHQLPVHHSPSLSLTRYRAHAHGSTCNAAKQTVLAIWPASNDAFTQSQRCCAWQHLTQGKQGEIFQPTCRYPAKTPQH